MKKQTQIILCITLLLLGLLIFNLQVFVFESPDGILGFVLCLFSVYLIIGSVLKLNDHIKNVKDVIPLYDALCVPSLHEGWSNSISEGICCGRPMLVGDVSDNKRMVHCNKNGFLFNPTDIQSMYNAFTAFLNLCYSERVKMGECSRKYALQLFCEENFVKSYIKLIEDVA